jgi:hypothetical protein
MEICKQQRATLRLPATMALAILIVCIMGPKLVEADPVTPAPVPPGPPPPNAKDPKLCLKCTQTMPDGVDTAPNIPDSSYGNCFSPPLVTSEGGFTYNRTEDYCTDEKDCFVETKGRTVTRGCGSKPGAGNCPMDKNEEVVTWGPKDDHKRVCQCKVDTVGGCNTFTVGKYQPPTAPKTTTPDPDGAGSMLGVTFQFFSLLGISMLSKLVYNGVLQ